MISISQIFNELNDSQKLAVTTTEGPVLIVAGPGTGKTLTIVRRIAYLIHQGIKPENILAVTFTNRASREMRERTGALLGGDASKVFIGTFHVLGLRIINEEYPDNFIVYNREEQINLLKKLIKGSDSGKISQWGRSLSYVLLAEKISRIKNFIEDMDGGIKRIYEEYQASLIKDSALDFDDLILRPLQILGNSELLERYRGIFRYIMVDEYQDINPAQYKLLSILTHSRGNLCSVGDSDQAIYAFRGADVGNFLRFERDYEDVTTITLTENYRSTGVILNASNILVKNNKKRIDKDLKPTRERGARITVVSVSDERAEGEMIVREIEERMGGTSHYQLMKRKIYPTSPLPEGRRGDFDPENSYSFSDFAVIYRTNAQAKVIAEAFNISGIPHQVIGEKYSSKRKDMMNILSLLKILINPADNLHFRRVKSLLPEELDETFFKKIENLKNALPINEFLKLVWEESGMEKYYDEKNFTFLIDLTYQYQSMNPGDALNSFINEVSLLTPSDDFDSRAEAVTLMTLHMAKGLEFKIVFITGVEDGLIPYTLKKEDVDIEEERRLFYVGMTRAMDELFLIHTRNRFLYGQRLTQSQSPFLKEIPDEFIESRIVPDRKKKSKRDRQTGLF
jgi:DNA helicase-2/ATP-dependent DNA helicase PcrA